MSPTLFSATDQHRKKRPFQPAITSYFHAAHDLSDIDSSDADDDNDRYSRATPRLRSIPQPKPPHPTLAPTLPDAVQSSLLSVGMRVRKSVPEGYKTPKPLVTPTTHSSTPLRKPHSAYRDSSLETLHIPVDTLASTLQHQRELLPFCGLNKIGGYAEQPTTHPLFGAAGAFTLPAHSFSQPFSSQDSGYGTDMQRSGAKRVWSEESDVQSTRAAGALGARGNNFLFSIPARVSGEDDIPVSPLSESPPPNLPPQRSFAQPKTRRRPLRNESEMDVEAVAHAGRLAAGHASDFEEADFLQVDEDMVMEVDGVGV